MHDRNLDVEGSSEGCKTDFIVQRLGDARLYAGSTIQDSITCSDRLFSDLFFPSVIGALETLNQVK